MKKAPATEIQGEGDYKAAGRYEKGARDFVVNGGVESAAKDAEARSTEEADELAAAENEGMRRRKVPGK